MHRALGLKGVQFAKRLGIKPSYLTSLRKGRSKGKGYLFWGGIKREFPEWEGYLKGEAETPPTEAKARPYTQEEEQMLAHPRGGPQRDMDAGSYGAPDLSGYSVVKVIEPSDAVYMRKVEEIFAASEDSAAAALKANIDQFHRIQQIRREFERKLDEMREQIRREVRKEMHIEVVKLRQLIHDVLITDLPPQGLPERRRAFVLLKKAIGE